MTIMASRTSLEAGYLHDNNGFVFTEAEVIRGNGDYLFIYKPQRCGADLMLFLRYNNGVPQTFTVELTGTSAEGMKNLVSVFSSHNQD